MSVATGPETSTMLKRSAAAEPLIQLLDELRQLTVRAGRQDLTGRIGMARTRISDPRVRVVVVGEPKKGMSTLVNGLVGADVAATNSPSSVPVVVEYGESLSTTIVRGIGQGRTERQPVDPNDPKTTLRQSSEGVLRAEFTVPHPLLAEGVVILDAPGAIGDDPTRAGATMSMLAAADAALYVSEAGREYSPQEIAYLRQIRQICPTVICVLNKIDVYPQWGEVQQANRRHLDDAGMSFAIFPVSSGMRDYANRSGDRQLDIESGVPQLIDYLRDQVLARADTIAREAALNDIQTVSDNVAMALQTEAETLRDPRRTSEITDRLRAARDKADQLRTRSANWQLALSDGYTELMNDIEHDLRHRLRSLVRDAEAEIMKTDPAKRWSVFHTNLDAHIADAVADNFVMAHNRSVELAEDVAKQFPAEDRVVALPELHLDDTDAVLEPVAPLEPLDSAKLAIGTQILNTLRGSYGGLLMVGLVSSLVLKGYGFVNPYSITAAVLLGISTYFDDQRNRKQRRQSEARVAVARLMDDVIFQVSRESRFRLRAVQRTLRDHFTAIANETLRSVDDSLRAAEEAGTLQVSQRDQRLAEIDRNLDQVQQVRRSAVSITAASA